MLLAWGAPLNRYEQESEAREGGGSESGVTSTVRVGDLSYRQCSNRFQKTKAEL